MQMLPSPRDATIRFFCIPAKREDKLKEVLVSADEDTEGFTSSSNGTVKIVEQNEMVDVSSIGSVHKRIVPSEPLLARRPSGRQVSEYIAPL
jgi:hypothetical protein